MLVAVAVDVPEHDRDPDPPQVRPGHDDAPVEATRPKDGWVENVRTVGGRDDDDALVRLEPVHLDQKLVQRLFALIMTTT